MKEYKVLNTFISFFHCTFIVTLISSQNNFIRLPWIYTQNNWPLKLPMKMHFAILASDNDVENITPRQFSKSGSPRLEFSKSPMKVGQYGRFKETVMH